MFTVISSMLAGMAAGFALRRHKSQWQQHAVTALIWALLFMLGLGIGSNDGIFNSMGSIGLRSAAIGTAATIGSAAASWLLWKKTGRDRQ